MLLGTILAALLHAYSLAAVPSPTPPANDGNVDTPLWQQGAHATLDHELTYRKGNEGNSTDVYVLTDKQYVYIGWRCRQKVPVVAQQVNNDTGTGNDDFVSVYLWPAGSEGVLYTFTATAGGAHDESSTENVAFAPHWQVAVKKMPDGYAVTMRIPQDVLHANGANDWRIQLFRYVSLNGERLVWAYDDNMSSPGDALYSGTYTGIGKVRSVASTMKRRVQAYGLTSLAPGGLGGDTSRLGMDYSIPLSSTTSFYGTVHPDYSEVEYDQQSIAPSEFRRFYREVRPFFTQGANYFNATGLTDLYTPSIPTPRYGYAVEGTNNGLHYAAFNAVGDGRDDNAQVIRYGTSDERYAVAYQRTAVEMPGFSDLTQSASVTAGNGKHFSAYTIFGQDDNSAVGHVPNNKYHNFGADLYAPNESIGFNLNSIDEFYNPFDGFITNPDSHGYNAYVNKTWNFTAKSPIQSVSFGAYLDRFHAGAGPLNQTDNSLYVTMNNDRNSGISLISSSSYYAVPGHGMTPYNQPGVYVWENANPAQYFFVGYYAGHYLTGFERFGYAGFTVAIVKPLKLSIYHSQNVFTAPTFPATEVQTLDSASLSYEYSRYGALSVGFREIRGRAADFSPLPYGRSTNLSFALNQRLSRAHIYAVYGDPNSVNTKPSFVLKLVQFLEGDEGT